MTTANTLNFTTSTKELIDELKSVCAGYGLGNSASEFDIISQIFLYKFLNDCFAYEIKQLKPELQEAEDWQMQLEQIPEDEYDVLQFEMNSYTAFLKPHQLIGYLFQRQNEPDFAKLLDDTLLDIAANNNELFAVKTEDGQKVQLFDRITENVKSKRDAFAKALLNKLVIFNFENIMEEGFDFFSTIFEYLIKDYNSDAGGKYAEYYTPHAVSKIIANILVPKPVSNVTIYDPSAGSGTLLMNLAHAIGPNKCTVYSQDISQKSSNLLRLNLVMNQLVHSIENVIQGNTMTDPYHIKDGDLRKFDYIVSNPPFKLDFSDDIDILKKKENKVRFFAGIPNIPPKKKDSMAIFTLFLQHIIYSLSENGKAAIVVPTGFITAQSGIEKRILKKIVDEKMLMGVITMPSNIFATTNTNVSILFLDTANKDDVVLIDASKLGEKIKDSNDNQKTVLTKEEEHHVINSFTKKQAIRDFSVTVSYEDIKAKNYSLSAGQYFEVKIEYVDISEKEFVNGISDFKTTIKDLQEKSNFLNNQIQKNLESLTYE